MSKKPNGYWKDWTTVERHIKELIDTLGHFPTQDELNKIGYGSLNNAIINYYHGYFSVRERMGYTPLKRRHGYWQDWENVERELREAIKINNGIFTSHPCLIKMGLGSLSQALKYHGGYHAVRKRMGIKEVERQKGYWKDYKNVEAELKKVIKLNDGVFPSSIDLRKSNLGTLETAINRYHGGIESVRRRMGYNESRFPRNYWKDFSNIKTAIDSLIEKLGHFPSASEINKFGIRGLINGIRHHHGLEAIKQRMGLQDENQLERIVNDYVDGGGKDGTD